MSLDEDALTTLAEELANTISEEPGKRMLIVEALRNMYRKNYQSSHISDIPQYRFYVQRNSPYGDFTIYDFQTISVYMERVEFHSDETCNVFNARTGLQTTLRKDAAHVFRLYLQSQIPDLSNYT